jgi:hypothetical protein
VQGQDLEPPHIPSVFTTLIDRAARRNNEADELH